MSSKRAVNNKTNERRSPRSTMLLFRSTPRAKQVERDISHDARTAADTARSSHAWIRACRQLRMCTPKRGQQVHEALEFFLCESFAKHGERCRIWEAERFSTAERIALGVGRTRVRDEAEPLHDEALSGGGAIFFVVTWLRNRDRLRSCPSPGGRNIGISCGWVLRCLVKVLASLSLTTFIRRAKEERVIQE